MKPRHPVPAAGLRFALAGSDMLKVVEEQGGRCFILIDCEVSAP